MPKLKKRIVKIEDNKLRLVMQCFLSALESNQVQNSTLIAERSITSGFWSLLTSMFPAGIQGAAIDLLSAKEYILHEVEFKMDATAEILHEEYNDFWVNVLKQDGIVSEDIISTKINNHNVLIYQLLLRMCADALSVNITPTHDGVILLNTMHSFIKNIKGHEQLLMHKKMLSTMTLSEISISLATDHEIWMAWMAEMVDVVKTIHANLRKINDLRAYLKLVQGVIRKQLLAELTTQENVKRLEATHFHDELLNKNLRELEDQTVDLANGIQPTSTKDRAIRGRELAMQRASGLSLSTNSQTFPERALTIISSINGSKPSILSEGLKVDNISRLYTLLYDLEIISEIVTCLETLDTTMGWIAIMTGVVKLEVVAKLIRDFARQCGTILRVNPKAPIFKLYPSISLALISGGATSATQLANLGIIAAAQLQELQHPNYLKRIGSFIKNALERLLNLETILPGKTELVDKKVCAKLLGEQLLIDKKNEQPQIATNNASLEMSVKSAEEDILPPMPPGLVYQKVPGDGHCLFRSVGIYVNQDQQVLRNRAVAYLHDNWQDFRGFITLGTNQTKENYLALLKRTEWADHVVIEVLMQLLNRPILAVGTDGRLININDVKRFRGAPIFVYYNGINHYDVLTKAPDYDLSKILAYLTNSSARQPTPQRKLKLFVHPSEMTFLKRKKTREKEFIHLYPVDQEGKWSYVYWKKGKRLGIYKKQSGTVTGDIVDQRLKKGALLNEEEKNFLIDFILDPAKREEFLSIHTNSEVLFENEKTEVSSTEKLNQHDSTQSIITTLNKNPERTEVESFNNTALTANQVFPSAEMPVIPDNPTENAETAIAADVKLFYATVCDVVEAFSRDIAPIKLDIRSAQNYISSLISVIRKNKFAEFDRNPELFGIPPKIKPILQKYIDCHPELLLGMRFKDESKRIEVDLARLTLAELREALASVAPPQFGAK